MAISLFPSSILFRGYLFLLDSSGKILTANSAACRLAGKDHISLVGTPVWALPGIKLPAVHEKQVRQAIDAAAEGVVSRFEASYHQEGEEKLYLDCTLKPYLDEKGEAVFLINAGWDITRQKNAESELTGYALHDALTGLANRRLFADRILHALSKCSRSKKKCSVLFIDLDGFKSVNDSLGHGVGDILLCEVAGRIQESTRQVDTVSRYGGDEFVVLLEELESAEAVEIICRRIMNAIIQPVAMDSGVTAVTASIGVSLYPENGTTAEELLSSSDGAMYIAKRSGKNCYCFA